MSISWSEASNLYKKNKRERIDGYEETSYKKKKHPHKTKRSKHKHEYIPAIYYLSFTNFNSNVKHEHVACGRHCKYCGRVEDMHFVWLGGDTYFKKFKEKYPEYIEVTLPDEWDFFKHKNIPVDNELES